MATKINKADRDIALAEIEAIISEESVLGSRYFESTYKLKVRAGGVAFDLYKRVIGDDNATAQTTEFATICNTLGIAKDKPFLGKRAYSVVSEDYIAYRAESVTAGAFTVASVEAAKSNGGKSVASFRAIAPALRNIVNAANNKATTSNRAAKPETVAAQVKLTNDKNVAWNYGYCGSFSGEYEDGSKWTATVADKNMVRGLLNRSHVDMAALRAIAKDDVELVRALINGVLDDVKRNGPTANVDKDADTADIESTTNSKGKSKSK